MSKVAPSEVEEANQPVVEKEPEAESSEKEWGNPIEFLMTLLSFAVGLGNVWRFPYLCFKNGGSAFIIAMVIMLFGAGLPLFFLEISIAQFSKFSTIDVWKIVPPLRGLGYVSLLIPTGIIIYYNILIAYSLIYAISSFLPNLPWATCNFEWNDARCCSYAKVEGSNETIVCGLDTESPARQYFYNYVLEFSEGIEYFDAVNWKLAIALFACWLLVFLSLSKGVQSLGKVSYFTAIFPYIMIFVLIVRGATLDGASLGIKYYVGTINWEKLGSLECWTDASSQVYFILGVGQGGLYTLGKHNKFNYNHKRAAVFIAILDGLTGILAGFAIFSVLGYMSKQTGIPVPELAVGGPGLSFIVYAEALSLMPLPQLWCVLFFLMMITIGFGSSLSLCECVLNSLAERFSKKINTKTKNTLFRFGICMIFFCIAFPMSTRAGLYIQNLIDEYLSGYPFYLFAFFEALGLCWLYGIKRIREDVYLMLKTRPGIYWTITFAIVPVLTFAVLIIFTIKLAQNPLVYLNDYVYPPGAQAIGWIIVAVVVAPLPIFFILHLIEKKPKLNKESLLEFIEPHPDWKPALPAGYNTESDELVVQSHDASLEMEKINENPNKESELDKDRRLSQTVLE